MKIPIFELKFLAAEPGRGQQHCFSRDLASHFCVACQDAWPGNDGVVSKFHKCSNCGKLLIRMEVDFDFGMQSLTIWLLPGLSVHTGCRYIAKRCYPCVPNAAHPKLLSADLLTLETRGIYSITLYMYGYLTSPHSLRSG